MFIKRPRRERKNSYSSTFHSAVAKCNFKRVRLQHDLWMYSKIWKYNDANFAIIMLKHQKKKCSLYLKSSLGFPSDPEILNTAYLSMKMKTAEFLSDVQLRENQQT